MLASVVCTLAGLVLQKRIDRVYVCKQCNSSFLFQSDVDEHHDLTGHSDILEFPFGADKQR